jgi:adenosylcobinamide kinase / adenosylcobinamide-phosphate guanylyltransferase
MGLTFVLGGARSGKTALALREALARPAARRIMIATAEALDGEMSDRIARHRAERGADWTTVEAPRRLADAVADLAQEDVAVIDCLTLWITNLMLDEADVGAAVAELIAALAASPANLIVISNEVGQGIVPDNALARRFRDEAGWAHQALAVAADRVVFVTAGLGQALKG